MRVSVVICTYTEDLYPHLREAAESILQQTHSDIELVLVSDGSETVYDLMLEEFGDREDTVVTMTEENVGISEARNRGIEMATGDIVAQIDDDAVAEPNWAEELVKVYEATDALAVGGPIEGVWLAPRPWYLPEEFDWLVGVTFPGFADDGDDVRNTFESNLSFRREVFLDLGGYHPDLGPRADRYRHSEGAELGARLVEKYDSGVIYSDEAIVRHKVFPERTRLWWLLTRAFEQGVSKRKMEQVTATASEEYGYLRRLFLEALPRRVAQLIRRPSLTGVGQLVMLFVFTATVGLGYGYGLISGLVES